MGPVTLTFPAESVNVALARTVTAALAASADLPIDRVEDARLAVDEAVTQVLAGSPSGSSITCAFTISERELQIMVRGPWSPADAPSTGSFGWMVMTALCDRVAAHLGDGSLTLDLAVLRTVDAEA